MKRVTAVLLCLCFLLFLSSCDNAEAKLAADKTIAKLAANQTVSATISIRSEEGDIGVDVNLQASQPLSEEMKVTMRWNSWKRIEETYIEYNHRDGKNKVKTKTEIVNEANGTWSWQNGGIYLDDQRKKTADWEGSALQAYLNGSASLPDGVEKLEVKETNSGGTTVSFGVKNSSDLSKEINRMLRQYVFVTESVVRVEDIQVTLDYNKNGVLRGVFTSFNGGSGFRVYHELDIHSISYDS